MAANCILSINNVLYQTLTKSKFTLKPNNRNHDNRILESKHKQTAGESGINKNITWHMSRHTFATLALTKGMSIESVSKILGHTNINTTQIYAKIINEKLTHEFHIIEQKLKFK
jgi:site-specific recombinase XerD